MLFLIKIFLVNTLFLIIIIVFLILFNLLLLFIITFWEERLFIIAIILLIVLLYFCCCFLLQHSGSIQFSLLLLFYCLLIIVTFYHNTLSWYTHQYYSPIDWGCIIHWQHLCIEIRPTPSNKCPGYDTKQSDGSYLWVKLNCLMILLCVTKWLMFN